MRLDAVIFGGGVAGLWTLDELTRRGCSAVLLEAHRLGDGQTVASQGIIHGGLKYTLSGLLTRSAANIREMPLLWRECLAGRREPDLKGVRMRSEFCCLWRTGSLSGRLGMIGAKIGLRVAPQPLPRDERPEVLAACPGEVARLDEPVICPASLMDQLQARHGERILKIDPHEGLSFESGDGGHVRAVRLFDRDRGEHRRLRFEPRQVIFTAGSGNVDLRRRVGLPAEAMQRRPLHMVLVRGGLPKLNGHCVDGAGTRVTVTSGVDSSGRTVWQVGGQLAEDGVHMEEAALIEHARRELTAVIPGVDLSAAEWAAYCIDRAEGATRSGRRPETVELLREGNCITAWPTKLALAPVLAEQIAAEIEPLQSTSNLDPGLFADWPRPAVAPLPWEAARDWRRFTGGSARLERAA